MYRAVARRAVASVGALSSAVGGVGTGGSTRAIRRRTFSSGAGGSMDSKIPLMSVALGAAATATAYEAARSLEKPNPTPRRGPNPELIPGKSTASKSSKAAAAVEKKETEKKEPEKKEPEKKELEKKEPEKKEEPKAPVAKSDADLFYAQLLTQRRIFLNGRGGRQSAHTLVGKMLFLDAADPTKPIVMYINSGGGVVTSGLAIYDVMQHVR